MSNTQDPTVPGYPGEQVHVRDQNRVRIDTEERFRNSSGNNIDTASLRDRVVVTNVDSASISTGYETDFITIHNDQPRLNGGDRDVLVRAGEGDDTVHLDARYRTTGSLHGGTGDDSFVLNLGADPVRITLQGDAGQDRLIINNPNQYNVTPRGNGIFELTTPNGSTITLIGIEKIQHYSGSSLMAEVQLGALNHIAPDTSIHTAFAHYGRTPGG